MIDRVRIQTDPDSPQIIVVTNAETDEPINGVKHVTIDIHPFELPIATVEVFTEFAFVAKPHWKPIFAAAGHCESCRHWEAMNTQHGHCELPYSEQFPNSGVCTRKDFGCVLWEPKDVEVAS